MGKGREKGQGGSGSQEQPRRDIMKGDKLGRQGGSQEQPRMEIMKGDKLARQGGSGSQEVWKGNEGRKCEAVRMFGFCPD